MASGESIVCQARRSYSSVSNRRLAVLISFLTPRTCLNSADEEFKVPKHSLELWISFESEVGHIHTDCSEEFPIMRESLKFQK